MTEFTQDDKKTIRSGVMGAVALVSQADPGFFDVFKESKAAAEALKNAPAGVQDLMKGGLVLPPQASSKEELKSKILGELSQAVSVAGKNPSALEAVRSYVMAACQQVAEASKGVSGEEQAVIAEIQQVLSAAPAQQAPQAQPADQAQQPQIVPQAPEQAAPPQSDGAPQFPGMPPA